VAVTPVPGTHWRDQLDATLRAVGDGITVSNADGTLLYANDQAARMLGFGSVYQLMNTPPAEVRARVEIYDESGAPLPSEQLPAGLVLRGAPEANATVRWRVRGEAEERWSEIRATPVRDPEGADRLAVSVFRDITARHRADEWRRLLLAAGDALANALEVGQTAQQIVELAVPALADWCVVDLASEHGTLETAALAHRDPEKVELARELRLRYPFDLDARRGAAAVIRTGRSELRPEIREEALFESAHDDEHLRLLRELGMRSLLIVPLKARGRVLGALTLVWAETPRRYGEEDLEFAEDLARRLAMAVDNARLYQREREARVEAQFANERLSQLHEIAEIGLQARSLDELLERLLAFVRDLLRGDRATMLLLDEEAQELRVRAAVGLQDDVIAEVRVPLGKGIAGTIASSRKARVIDDVAKARPVSSYLRDAGGSLVGVPLHVDDRVIGVLHVTADRKRAFSELDLGFLELVGERAALALERTAAYEHEHATAVTLQRSVLPDRLPEIPGVETAARYLPGSGALGVGGDWYDVLPLSRGRVALVVGDVVGKGVEAAATMAQIRNAVRVYALEGLKPSTIIARLQKLVGETFATLLLAVVAPDRSRCRYANAGHLPPLLVRRDGTAEFVDGGRSLPLGTPADERPGESSFRIEPGDTLVLYTDGLVEHRQRSLEEGFELLRRSVSDGPPDLEALLDHVVAQLLEERSTPDDVALLAFRMTSRPAEPFELRLDGDIAAVASMRRRLTGWLDDVGVDAPVQREIVLVCNELCANAIEHAIAPSSETVEVKASKNGDSVEIQVRDFGRWRKPTPREGRGFGLKLVAALADDVDIASTDSGTRVRASRRI
jgi:serine phosphatase RsbU (regulator of sigma subunit)